MALIARGDTQEQIREYMKNEVGRSVSRNTIMEVKKRNKKNLDILRNKLLVKEEAQATALRSQANKIVKRKLDQEDKKLDVLEQARLDYLDGKIPLYEYVEIVKANRELSLNEVVNVSKVMHDQAKSEDEVPPEQRDTGALVSAIRSGDEVTLQQIIFNKKEEDPGGIIDSIPKQD